ncbi:alpha/beta hydrolase [Streptomyces sp. VNUA24]|uniref:alpha/beta hydrolase n=1 Tax=Streptomyces sp. VNUA24 TaxID=3031131 RepID=UPI0023B7AC00|nr:alpha/beta hydrolase [Streptomyces sp. VNUA24]WEH14802.1 alpha/beta hydrolase [Streptomyces sp. VNUA24]
MSESARAPMTPKRTPSSPVVEKVELAAGDVRLSGLLALPRGQEPRAVLVALHGGGMGAGYFHGQADPSLSLLSLAAATGYAALAMDRPGYGASAGRLPHGMRLAEQAACVRAALRTYAVERGQGAPFFLVGHSLGGKLALTTVATAEPEDGLLGVDVSGVGERWALSPTQLATVGQRHDHRLHWGPLALYPPGTFRLARHLVGPVPSREAEEIPQWPLRYAGLARRIRVPVRFTFAEHERFWACDPEAVRELTAPLLTPLVRTDRLTGAGHNISLGYAARRYHLSVLSFLEECRARATA